MPPPTPRMTLLGATAWRYLVGIFFQQLVFNQAAAHLFHGDDGRLLGGGGQKRPGAVLKLSRALGGHDDKTVDALLRIVRDRAMGVILWSLFRHRYKPHRT